jgi:hypothetical protein
MLRVNNVKNRKFKSIKFYILMTITSNLVNDFYMKFDQKNSYKDK